MLKGIGASAGIAAEKIFVLKKEEIKFGLKSNLSAAEEKDRFSKAVLQFAESTQKLVAALAESAGAEESAILEGHILMCQDPEITGAVDALILGEQATSEHAVDTSFGAFRDLFASMDDELMSQRASDLVDIKTRLLEILTGKGSSNIANIDSECILVTHDLTPSDTGQMNKALVKGIITEVGGTTSHTAIISRAMELPAVLGIDGVTDMVKTGEMAVMNGQTGEIILNPTQAQLDQAAKMKDEFEKAKSEFDVYKNKPSETADRHSVILCANIGGVADLDSVLKNDAEGVGLFRTEFLFMDRKSVPTEEEQFEVYKKVAETLNGKHVIIRTLDIGGDKDVPYLGFDKEDNPFLGYRAVRLCLDRKDIFKPQLLALLRASAFGDIKIMIPMISCVDELRQSKALLAEAKAELDERGISYDANIQVGIMIETPAAAAISDILAKECDFFSIGTNDLTQYTMAVDRGNKRVAYLYSTFNPAVIRLIAQVIANGKKEGIMVGMCGEAAGDPAMIPFLLAAGLDEFSMTASHVLKARKLISSHSYEKLREKLPEMLSLATPEEVKNYLQGL